MGFLIIFCLLIYFAVCGFLIFVILIQSGKGGGLSSLAGASEGLSQALGSTSSERTLSRMTSYCAIAFVVLAIVISLLGEHRARTNGILDLGNGAGAPAMPLSGQPTVPPSNPGQPITETPASPAAAASGATPAPLNVRVAAPTGTSPIPAAASPVASGTAPAATPGR